jgi:hypothetical protein
MELTSEPYSIGRWDSLMGVQWFTIQSKFIYKYYGTVTIIEDSCRKINLIIRIEWKDLATVQRSTARYGQAAEWDGGTEGRKGRRKATMLARDSGKGPKI